MKYLLTILICWVFTNTATSQCDNSLIGKWKVVAELNGGTYFNLKTDSIQFSPLMAVHYLTDSLKKAFLAFRKNKYRETVFHFKNDSSFHARLLDDDYENIRYCFQKTVNKIQLISEDSLGRKIINERTASIKNGFLYMTISPPEMKDYIFEIMLERLVEH
jgi:hypothetical protein